VIFADDPLLSGSIDLGVVLIVLLKTVLVFAFLLVGVMLMVWFERKLISDMQNRIGPNRAGPFGVLQTFADGIKLFFKEDLLPDRADRRIFRLAPYLSLVPAFLVFSVVPLGGVFNSTHDGTITILHHDTYVQLADPPIGVLLALVFSSLAVYGVMLAGWSSGSKYPLLGSVRATAQMV
jgi:NADH-quinone oxidoreductase subunit H